MTTRRAVITLMTLTTLGALLLFGWTVLLIKALPMLTTPLPVPPHGWWRP